jgi:two-component system, chemotaxis family, CheB/CheR fusion protein
MKTSKKVSKTAPKKDDFPIVGIGASAGGLEALEQFFGNMPKDSGMAFVVIQHLDPDHVGIMPELLQRSTEMKVIQAKDLLKVKPNCIYVIPPNKSMSILNGKLHLFAPVETRGLRLPIDIFFRSLAEDRLEKSIGIILSGMGSDGSLGMKAIKGKNGIVAVQDPVSAKFDSMPRRAIESSAPFIIASAADIPAKLIDYLKFVPSAKAEAEPDEKDMNNLDKIIILLRDQTGHDFSLYKKNTLFRRIERRKGIHQLNKISSYVRFLQENPKETEILFKELLIGVTRFFRDESVWKKLRESILPDLIKKLPDNYMIRAWVPACSTGEEAYSLAIIFKEVMEKNECHKKLSMQIFATDIDHDSIDIARKAHFSDKIAEDVSSELLKRYFTVEAKGYCVKNVIREMIVFAPHNVTKDPPFTKLDFLACRNMLIYMEPELQKKLISLFNYSLNPNGILLLGTSETLGVLNDGFIDLDSKLKFFKRSASASISQLSNFPSFMYHRKELTTAKKTHLKGGENIQTLADQILLQQFSPASVLTNDRGDIIYITGRTGKYLEPVAGKANWNIHAMAREGLSRELPGLFRTAIQSNDPVIVRNIRIEEGTETNYVDITVQRLENPESLRGMLMTVFNDVRAEVAHKTVSGKTRRQNSKADQNEYEAELKKNNEELQIIREEAQTSQEELQSTNEELQSTNEELQSTNEELTTSKEEMQSLNEELQTVNAELQSKINDFTRTNDDMKNLLNSTEIATLFLDRDLNIRRFTDHVVKIFKLRNVDIGRPFTDLVNDLQYPEIKDHALEVLKTLIFKETAIETNDKRWFTIRIMPYRTMDDRIDGLVITFSDITIAKKLEIELQKQLKANKIKTGIKK